MAALVLAASGFAIPRLAAQDVAVTPLEWLDTQDAPDQLPVENHPLRPDFPDDLRHAPDPGYAVVDLFVGAEGNQLSQRVLATLPAYERAVEDVMRFWKHQPGRRAGRAVNTLTRFVVIFNPAGAAVNRAEAAPRLLAAEPVIIPHSAAGRHAMAPEVVWATVQLDAAGGLVGLKDAPPELAAHLEEAVRSWRFAPARRDGRPVAAELRVPIILTGPYDEAAQKGEVVPPHLMHQPHAEYPAGMRTSGLRGDVLVDFVVDREGRVIDAYVARSLNPSFDEAALEAVRQSEYEPGRRGDVPVNTRMHVEIHFEMRNHIEGGDSGIEVEHKGNSASLPPEFRYDVPPKPRGTVRPIYPYALLRDGIDGKARVHFLIDTDGHIIFSAVDAADRPEFGAALQAAIECFEFEPALRGGRPTRTVYAFEQPYSAYDHDGVITREDRNLLALERKHPERIVSAAKLDARLHPISRRPPRFPLALAGKIAAGDAVVEFLVDEDGRARLPRVVSASDPAFGWAAVQAVAVWRFDPPKSAGKSVVTRIRVPFSFTGPAAPPPAKSH